MYSLDTDGLTIFAVMKKRGGAGTLVLHGSRARSPLPTIVSEQSLTSLPRFLAHHKGQKSIWSNCPNVSLLEPVHPGNHRVLILKWSQWGKSTTTLRQLPSNEGNATAYSFSGRNELKLNLSVEHLAQQGHDCHGRF